MTFHFIWVLEAFSEDVSDEISGSRAPTSYALLPFDAARQGTGLELLVEVAQESFVSRCHSLGRWMYSVAPGQTGNATPCRICKVVGILFSCFFNCTCKLDVPGEVVCSAPGLRKQDRVSVGQEEQRGDSALLFKLKLSHIRMLSIKNKMNDFALSVGDLSPRFLRGWWCVYRLWSRKIPLCTGWLFAGWKR